MIRKTVFIALLLAAVAAPAAERTDEPAGGRDERAVYVHRVEKPITAIYDNLYKSLEDARFFVVLEPKISENISRFKERWGENYNRNALDAIRSMVFCNGWYANEISNRDPEMLALCPLRLTLIEKDGETRVLFVRPARVGVESPALDVLQELEQEVISAIRAGVE